MTVDKVKHYFKDYPKKCTCANCSDEVTAPLVVIVHYKYDDDIRSSVPTNVVGIYECPICGHSCKLDNEMRDVSRSYFLFGIGL